MTTRKLPLGIAGLAIAAVLAAGPAAAQQGTARPGSPGAMRRNAISTSVPLPDAVVPVGL